MDAILLAGGIPAPEDPLFPFTKGKPKAALELGGKLMIQWVLDVLEESPSIASIVMVGSEELKDDLRSSKVLDLIPAGRDIMENFQRGADAVLSLNPSSEKVAVVSSDIPLITPEGVEWVVKASRETDLDIYYCVIQQALMEDRFPASARSYVKLRDMNVCGGDIAVISLALHKTRKDFWRKILEARKSYLHQAALIGFDILLLLLLRRLSLQEAVTKVTRRLGITGQALVCPYPEIGMDIDKPHQLELARQELTHAEPRRR